MDLTQVRKPKGLGIRDLVHASSSREGHSLLRAVRRTVQLQESDVRAISGDRWNDEPQGTFDTDRSCPDRREGLRDESGQQGKGSGAAAGRSACENPQRPYVGHPCLGMKIWSSP